MADEASNSVHLTARDRAKADTRVIAIRNDVAVGRDSCSMPDECWNDTNIVKILDDVGIRTAEGAVRYARECDVVYWERGTNCCSGESETDAPLLAMARLARERSKLPITV